MAAAGLLLPVRHKPAALDPDAWKSPRWTPTDADLDTTSTPVHSQALLGRGGHSRSPSPRPTPQSDFGLDLSAARSSNVYGGNSGALRSPMHSDSLLSARQHSSPRHSMGLATPMAAEVAPEASPRLSSNMSPRHSRHATMDVDPSLRSDLAASPRHSSSLSPRHSLQFRSSPTTPVTPERVVPDSAPSSSMQSTRPTYPSPGNSSPMHSQVLLELPTRHSSSPRRSPVAMDVELGSPSAPNVVRHKSLKIPDLPQRGEDSPGHRLSVCMSEEFRPLSQATFGADANERTPVGDGLDQFRPLSPQASPTRHDQLEKFRPLSPMSKAGQPVQPVDELDKYRPLSPASSIRSTVYPAERTLLPDSETEVQRLRLGLDDEPRKASPSTKDQDEAERRKSKESTRSALDEEIERQEAITKRLTMQLRSPKRLSPAVQQRALAALPATPVASRRSVSEPRLQQSPGAAPPGAMHSGWVPTGADSLEHRSSACMVEELRSPPQVPTAKFTAEGPTNRLQQSPGAAPPGAMHSGWVPTGADSLEHRSSACMVEELRSPPQVPTAKFAAEGPTNRPVLPMQQGNQVVDAESEEMQRLRAELATAKASAGQEAAKLRAELTTARDAEALAASECAKLQRELTSRDAEEGEVCVQQEELDRYRPLSTGSSIRSTAHLAERTLLPDSESLHPPGGGAAKSGVPWRRARGIAAAQDTCDEERRKSKESTRSADQETEREFAARRVASRAMMQVAPEPAFLAQLPGRVSPPVPATATPQASLRSASEPRLQRSAGTMTSGSGASSPSKERLRALESEVASQSKRIRVLEGELKTAESRASRLQASGQRIGPCR
eukprot:s4657_g1.t3